MNKRLLADFFREDHDRLERMFDEFCAARSLGLAAARSRFREFEVATRRHLEWEDNLLFPVYEARAGFPGHREINDMWDEHDHLQELIASIRQKLANQDLALEPEVTQLTDLMEMHHTKEEVVVYGLIDDTITDADRDKLFAQLDESLRAGT